jgi:hypothetical protein
MRKVSCIKYFLLAVGVGKSHEAPLLVGELQHYRWLGRTSSTLDGLNKPVTSPKTTEGTMAYSTQYLFFSFLILLCLGLGSRPDARTRSLLFVHWTCGRVLSGQTRSTLLAQKVYAGLWERDRARRSLPIKQKDTN